MRRGVLRCPKLRRLLTRPLEDNSHHYVHHARAPPIRTIIHRSPSRDTNNHVHASAARSIAASCAATLLCRRWRLFLQGAAAGEPVFARPAAARRRARTATSRPSPRTRQQTSRARHAAQIVCRGYAMPAVKRCARCRTRPAPPARPAMRARRCPRLSPARSSSAA